MKHMILNQRTNRESINQVNMFKNEVNYCEEKS